MEGLDKIFNMGYPNFHVGIPPVHGQALRCWRPSCTREQQSTVYCAISEFWINPRNLAEQPTSKSLVIHLVVSVYGNVNSSWALLLVFKFYISISVCNLHNNNNLLYTYVALLFKDELSQRVQVGSL